MEKYLLIGEAVAAIVLLAFFIWPGVRYESRTGIPFWFDRFVEYLGDLSGNGARRAKWIFFLTAAGCGGMYFYGMYADSQATSTGAWLSDWKLMVMIALGVVSLLSLLFLAGCRFLIHASDAKFTLPHLMILILSLCIGVVYGGYALCHRPGVPDGILWSLIKKAFTLNIKNEDLEWLSSVRYDDVGEYIRTFQCGEAWLVVVSIVAVIVVYELIVRHLWVYCRPIWRRPFYPVACAALAAIALQIGFVVGFVVFGFAFVLFCYLISLVIAIIMAVVIVKVMWAGAVESLTSSSGTSSSGGGYSSSSTSSDNSSSGSFTAIDGQGREYYGNGDTMYRDTPGDTGTFDRHNDGTWTSRYGDEVLKEKGPGD